MALGPQTAALLNQYGLGSLTGWASSVIINNLSPEEFELELFKRPEFHQRFPAIKAREKAGLPPLSVDEYLSYESFASQAANAFGVTLTKDEVSGMLSADISTAELEDRLGIAAQAVYQTNQVVRDELSRLYDIGVGDLVKYWLDPKKEAPLLQRRWAAASISAEAKRAGFRTDLAHHEAEALFAAGMDPAAARESFGELVANEELFESVDETEEDISLRDQLQLITGNQDVAQEVERRAAKRVARFQEGGGFATGQGGLAGLGSANR
jgi:hypothetical protein